MLNTQELQQLLASQIKITPIKNYGHIVYVGGLTIPALGGCRLVAESSDNDLIAQCTDLAMTMHFKSALHQLPLAGGKAIIKSGNKAAALQEFAQTLNDLKGQYITAVDMGIYQEDMDVLAEITPYLTCDSKSGGDPSSYTAETVLLGMQAALKWQNEKLQNKRVLVHGVGKVGYALVQRLTTLGAETFVTDKNAEALTKIQSDFNVQVISPEKALDFPCDIFSPCSQHHILNSATIPKLKAKIIAGATNNPATSVNDLQALHQRNILYLPDYLINAGGLIHCAFQWFNNFDLDAKIASVYDLTLKLLQLTTTTQEPLYQICHNEAMRVILSQLQKQPI